MEIHLSLMQHDTPGGPDYPGAFGVFLRDQPSAVGTVKILCLLIGQAEIHVWPAGRENILEFADKLKQVANELEQM